MVFFIIFRFFANSSRTDDSLVSSIENDTKSTSKNVEGLSSLYKPVHSNTANVYSSTTPSSSIDSNISKDVGENLERQEENYVDSVTITEVSKHFKFSKVKGKNSPKPSPRSGSAFNWSKFKFNRTNSTDCVSISQKNSNGVKSAFKKVVSESDLDKFLKGKKSNSDNESVNDRVASLETDSMATESDDSVAQSSYPYSIDSDCLRDYDVIETGSQILINSQKSDTSIATDDTLIDSSIKNKTGLSIYFKPGNNTESPICADLKKDFENNFVAKNEGQSKLKGDNPETETVLLIDSDDDSTCSLQIPAPFPRVIF